MMLFELRIGIDVVVGRQSRRFFEVIGGQKAEQPPADVDGLFVVFGHEMNHARMRHVSIGTPQCIGGDLLARDLLDDLRPGDEHLGLARLDNEVRQSWRVGCAPGTRSADQGDLRHGTG